MDYNGLLFMYKKRLFKPNIPIFKVQTFFIYDIYMTFNEYFNLTFSAVAEDQDPDYERPNS